MRAGSARTPYRYIPRRHNGNESHGRLWPTGLDAMRSPLKVVRPDGSVRISGASLFDTPLTEEETETVAQREAREARERAAKARRERSAGRLRRDGLRHPGGLGAEDP